MKFVGEDEYARCRSCESRTVGYSFTKTNQRSFILQTLHHRSISIAVRDTVCDLCGNLLPFDEATISLFALNKKHLFTREFLESWVWDICRTRGTLRDVFYSWHSRSSSKSSEINLLGELPSLNRQTANDAFSKFLTVLRFSEKEDLNSLFSGQKGEVKGAREGETMDAVVMDGTALGISEKLPEFERTSLTIAAMQRIPRLHYIMKVPRIVHS